MGEGGGILELRIWTKEKKLEIWILGGVFWNFGFGLRKNSWKFGFWGGILELRIWT